MYNCKNVSVLKLIVIVLNVTMISVTMLGHISLRVNMMIVFGLYVIILSEGGSITVLLTSCLAGLESAVWLLTIFIFICKTD